MTDILSDGSFWSFMGTLATVMVFFAGIVVGALRWMYARMQQEQERRIDAQFGALQEAIAAREEDTAANALAIADLREDHAQEIATVKDRVADLKSHVAEQYIHRRDWVRMEGSRDVAIRHIREDLKRLGQNVAALITKNDTSPHG